MLRFLPPPPSPRHIRRSLILCNIFFFKFLVVLLSTCTVLNHTRTLLLSSECLNVSVSIVIRSYMCPNKVKRGHFAVILTQLQNSKPPFLSYFVCMADLRHSWFTVHNIIFVITVENHELRHDQIYTTQCLWRRLLTRNTNSTKNNNNMYVYSLNTLRKSGEWLTSNVGFPFFRYCKCCHQFFHGQWKCSLCIYHMKRSLCICMGELQCLSIHFTNYTTYTNGACPL